MTVDTQESLLTYIWNLLTGDDAETVGLQAIMGDTVRCYLDFAKPDAVFPYLVHRIEIRSEPGTHVIQRATYLLDIWSHSADKDETYSIRKRLIRLLDELVFNTDDVSLVNIAYFSGGDVPTDEQGIWHYATIWDLVFRRDSEAASIEGR